ncbi:unnamed protein product [Ectocarpus sp. 12 AP-2014]
MSRVQPTSSLRRYLCSRSLPHFPKENAAGGGKTARVFGRGLAPGSSAIAADSTAAAPWLHSSAHGRLQDGGSTWAGLLTVANSRGRFSTASTSAAEAPDGSSAGAPQCGVGEDGGQAAGTGEGTQQEEDDDVFEDPRTAILDASLDHVEEHGFSATALAAGARDCGFHSVAAGMFPKGEADLVHHLMAKALHEVKRLSENSKEDEGGDGGASSGDGDESSPGSESAWPPSETERLRDGIKAAISCLVPYKSHWPHAMSIGLLPQNAGATATAVAVLADELAFLGGDRSTDLSWYGKRGIIAGMYASTELYMLTDKSEDLKDTWDFLDRLLLDYEILASSPENAADVATGLSTVATSLSSAAVSLAGPFLKQASKQVPGAEALAQTAPNVAALASQALSFIASQVPRAGQGPPFSGGASGPPQSASASSAATQTKTADDTPPPPPPTFPGAPEQDPWSGTHASAAAAASGKPGKFEEELAREERELFGDGEKKQN